MSVLNPCTKKSYYACKILSNGRHMIIFKKTAINHAKKKKDSSIAYTQLNVKITPRTF